MPLHPGLMENIEAGVLPDALVGIHLLVGAFIQAPPPPSLPST